MNHYSLIEARVNFEWYKGLTYDSDREYFNPFSIERSCNTHLYNFSFVNMLFNRVRTLKTKTKINSILFPTVQNTLDNVNLDEFKHTEFKDSVQMIRKEKYELYNRRIDNTYKEITIFSSSRYK